MVRMLLVAMMLVWGSVEARGDGSTCPMILSPKPTPSGSSNYSDQLLDRWEARLYGDARAGRIRWVQLVDQFYAECTKLHPGYRRNRLVEVSAYQRVLAEQMDNRRITESEWVYLLEKQAADIRARNQLIENARPRSTNCTTQNIGTPSFPTYQTHCF